MTKELNTEQLTALAKQFREMSCEVAELHSDPRSKALYIEQIEFRRTLTKESDRAAALMAGAYLDELLKTLISEQLVDDANIQKSVIGTGGAIDSFSSRINLAYLLGLIPNNIRYDLDLIRRIRNEFAHTAGPMDFEKDSVRSRCFLFKAPLSVEHLDASGRFLRASVVCANRIGTALLTIKRLEAAEDYDDTHTLKYMDSLNEYVKEKLGVDMVDIRKMLDQNSQPKDVMR
ncbi:hypothetical protein [Vibrio parahaemolyticus]|uniref:hypothetical protein n=1 Tax=Vibrio parahaemolyticus TaxID=670 RepID=UPI00248C8888|nr:hypothetical protein [Vibrio parahaemolyticus]